MAKWTSSTGNTVEILPWTDKGFHFISLDCEEVLGGKEAHGRIKMKYIPDPKDENTKMLTDENTVEIKLGTKDVGTKLDIHGIIIHREYLKNFLTIEFSCIPDVDFLTRRGTLVSDDIDSAISSLWRGEKDIRTTTDLPSGITFNQASELDYRFLQFLCESYRKETVFAFGLTGLLIKDLIGIDSTNNKEPYWTLPGNVHAIQDQGPGSDRYNLNYDPKLYMKPEDSWEESETQSEIWGVRVFNNNYKIIHKDYQIAQENRINNKKFYTSYMYNQIHLKHTNFLQDYRLGDVVKYIRAGEEKNKLPWGIYIISKIRYHYRTEPDPGCAPNPNEFLFSLDYTLHCLEEGGNIMSDKDPIKEIE